MTNKVKYKILFAAPILPAQTPFFDPNFLNIEYFFNLVPRFFQAILDFLASLRPGAGPYDLSLLKVILWILVFLFAVAIAYAAYKYYEVRRKEKEKYGEIELAAIQTLETTERNERWEKVIELLDSPGESDWRLSILEADLMLGDMLTAMAYHGDTIGEQLQTVDPPDFETLSEAWEAHKVRNRIAHEGTQFALSKTEAERVIDLFRRVFEEFHYI